MRRRVMHLDRITSWSRIALLAVAVTLSGAARAEELPAFKPGKWKFARTVEGQGPGGKPMQVEREECTDPTADMKKMNDTLAAQGCTFSAITRSGSTYSFSSDCLMMGTRYQSNSVITVEGDAAYRVQVTSTGSGPATKELLVATRIGDCAR